VITYGYLVNSISVFWEDSRVYRTAGENERHDPDIGIFCFDHLSVIIFGVQLMCQTTNRN
jgi:hypothetical protein